jgi:hypothetical protein
MKVVCLFDSVSLASEAVVFVMHCSLVSKECVGIIKRSNGCLGWADTTNQLDVSRIEGIMIAMSGRPLDLRRRRPSHQHRTSGRVMGWRFAVWLNDLPLPTPQTILRWVMGRSVACLTNRPLPL